MVPRGPAWELDLLPAGDFRSLAVLLQAARDLRPPVQPQTVVNGRTSTHALGGGAVYAGRLVDLCNQAALWFGWLPVPNPFKSKTAAAAGSGP